MISSTLSASLRRMKVAQHIAEEVPQGQAGGRGEGVDCPIYPVDDGRMSFPALSPQIAPSPYTEEK